MRKIVILALVCFLVTILGSCTENKTSSSGVVEETTAKPVPIVKIKNEKVKGDMPVYSFRVYGQKIDKNNASANKVQIYNNNKLVQEISFKATDVPSNKVGSIIEDMNFDGYKDMRILKSQPDGPNMEYYYWIWDKKTGKFNESKELEKISSPVFDSKNKLIKSYIKTSISNYNYYTYKYVNGKPFLFKETDTIFKENKMHITEKELVKGKMKIMREYDAAN